MAKGELPVPYIVALILAIVIIAVVAYMFFTQTGIFSGSGNEEQCNAKKLQWCLAWQRLSPTFESGPGQTPGDFSKFAPGCSPLDSTFCKQALLGKSS